MTILEKECLSLEGKDWSLSLSPLKFNNHNYDLKVLSNLNPQMCDNGDRKGNMGGLTVTYCLCKSLL